MKTKLAAAGAILLMIGTHAEAHRLDEYLQAATISLEKNHIQLQVRLAPGVAVVSSVLASIKPDANGIISAARQQAYAERVVEDLSLEIDGKRVPLRIVSTNFPEIQKLDEGVGEIQLDLEADVPKGGKNRRLTFENRHQSSIAAYLVNCLVPRDPDIRVTAQNRNYTQSIYQLDYVQVDGRSVLLSGLQSSFWLWSVSAALFVVVGVLLTWRRLQLFGVRRPQQPTH
jgi:hypothetical protein